MLLKRKAPIKPKSEWVSDKIAALGRVQLLTLQLEESTNNAIMHHNLNPIESEVMASLGTTLIALGNEIKDKMHDRQAAFKKANEPPPDKPTNIVRARNPRKIRRERRL